MITIKSVNKMIASKGILAEIVKGDGYYYFTGSDVELAEYTSVYVFKLNDMTMQQWSESIDSIVADHNARKVTHYSRECA